MSTTAGGARSIFVAGSTGVIGRAMLALAAAQGVRDRLVPHQRPRGPHTTTVAPPSDAIVCDLGDAAALTAALRGRATVVQLIGTMRTRFAAGDTYESSDIGTTAQLLAAARTAGVRHVVLLSSVGAGAPKGAYLRAKARAEEIVVASGIKHTIVRPSAFAGEERGAPLWLSRPMRAIGLGRWAPIAVDDVARVILAAALAGEPEGVLEGASLWRAVAAAHGRAE